MQLLNYYEILAIPSNADLNTIKKAFRSKVQVYHPDKNKTPEAVEQFRLVVEAYEILGDENKRNAYDTWLSAKRPLVPAVVPQSQEKRYEDWKRTARRHSKKYSETALSDLFLLEVFLGTQLIEELAEGTGGFLSDASDLLDGIFDLF